MLHELKHGQDPIERQISKVQVLDKGLLVRGDQTLQSAGAVATAETEVTVIYSRNQVEAGTDNPCRGFTPSQHPLFSQRNWCWPSLVRAIARNAFLKLRVFGKHHPRVCHSGVSAFASCRSLAGITIPDSVTAIQNGAFQDCSSLGSKIQFSRSQTFVPVLS